MEAAGDAAGEDLEKHRAELWLRAVARGDRAVGRILKVGEPLLEHDLAGGHVEHAHVGGRPAPVEGHAFVEPELLEVDAHHHVGIEGLADGGVVDPGVLVDPAGHFLLIDDPRLAHVLLDE